MLFKEPYTKMLYFSQKNISQREMQFTILLDLL